MATFTDSTILSRRNALAAAGAALMLAPCLSNQTGAQSVSSQTQEWLDLFDAFILADDRRCSAFYALDEAKHSARKLHPTPRFKFSHVSYGWGPGKPLGWHWFDGISPAAEISLKAHQVNRATIENYYDEHLSHGRSHKEAPDDEQSFRHDGERRKEESLADFDKWDADCRAIDQEHAVLELKEVEAEALHALNIAEDLIRAKPIDSFAAIAINLALWARYSEGDASEEPLIGVFRAATKLAGIPEFFDTNVPHWAEKLERGADGRQVQS